MNGIKDTITIFEDIKHVDEKRQEFWYARELMIVLDIKDGINFTM